MKTNEKVSNYIKLCNEWAEKFLQMDKEELKKRLPELKEDYTLRSPVWSPPG